MLSAGISVEFLYRCHSASARVKPILRLENKLILINWWPKSRTYLCGICRLALFKLDSVALLVTDPRCAKTNTRHINTFLTQSAPRPGLLNIGGRYILSLNYDGLHITFAWTCFTGHATNASIVLLAHLTCCSGHVLPAFCGYFEPICWTSRNLGKLCGQIRWSRRVGGERRAAGKGF